MDRDKLNLVREEALKELMEITDIKKLDELRVKYLGKKGILTDFLKQLKDILQENRAQIGQLLNQMKNEITSLVEEKEKELKKAAFEQKLQEDFIDITLPGRPLTTGKLHPVTRVMEEMKDIFIQMGFAVAEGPEVETDYYNFEALNIPTWHPARDSQDTFYIESKDKLVLRTHTSPVQIRAMQKYGAPLRGVVPGRVFRNEATDASHDHTFYQLEGLMIDKDISITHLVAVMKEMLSAIFKKEVKVRLRPGYFPFVEPGFELDFGCLICQGKGCPICKQSGWIEFVGSGLVHPNVLKAGGIDPQKWTGFAFGLGLTRLVMMKYHIDDIRLLQSGDLRFLNQF